MTSIEVLSPYNKGRPGLEGLLEKRARLRDGGASVMEIDLLRGGLRVIDSEHLPDCDYLVTLLRPSRGVIEACPISLRERLPIVPVPLAGPDDDLPLDLQDALDESWQRARYDRSVDYSGPPPGPPPGQEDREWAERLVAPARSARRDK